MKSAKVLDNAQRKDFSQSLNSVLIYIITSLVVLIISGTILAFAFGSAKPGKGMRKIDPSPLAVTRSNEEFTEFGRLRTLTRPVDDKSNGSPVIISPWISYAADDKPFFEELTQKNRKIQTVITDYFSSHTKKELLATNEKIIKTEILSAINKELVLGKIKAIYFSEYIFLD